MGKRMSWMIVFLTVVFGGIFGFNLFRSMMIKKFFSNMQIPASVVTVSKAELVEWQNRIPAVGTLEAVNGVDVSPQVEGIVQSINFQSGQTVNAGDLLVKLDDSVSQADLKNYLADLSLTQINYNRQKTLLSRSATASSDVDQARAKLEQAQAMVAKTQALIDQKSIRAPFAGRVGIRKINLGQYLSPGTPIVSLQAIKPLRVLFSLPEQYLPKLAVGTDVQLTTEAFPKVIFAGKITAIDAKSNQETHNILVQAQLPNEEEKLYPGLFADLQILLPQVQKLVIVPETAVDYSLFGNVVYAVKQEGKDQDGKPILRAYRQYVEVGEVRNGKVAILKGIDANAQVVTSGQLKLENGSAIKINNENELKPTKEQGTP